MRLNIREYVATIAANLDLPEPIVEIGSLQVAGQEGLADLRSLLPGKTYIGCDMREGPGVDRIENVETGLSFADGSIGTILCVDTLEHVFDVLAAFREFRRTLQPGGVLVVGSIMLFPIHSHPYDYWRFTPECFARLLASFDRYHVFAEGEPDLPHTVYGLACLEPAPTAFDLAAARAQEYVRTLPQDGRGCAWQPSLPWPGRGGAAALADIYRLEQAIAGMTERLLWLTDVIQTEQAERRSAIEALRSDLSLAVARHADSAAASAHAGPHLSDVPGDAAARPSGRSLLARAVRLLTRGREGRA